LKTSLTTEIYEAFGVRASALLKGVSGMIIHVSELEETGLRIDDVAAFSTALRDPAWQLDAIALEVEPDGADVLVRGRLAATVPLTCGRCLETFSAHFDTDVDLRFMPRPAEADSVELAADDLDVDFYEGDQLDLGRVVDNETTLAVPMKPLCRSDCQGLCAVCGANRNLVACTCAQRPPEPRWAALRDLAARHTN
jgi:uncharacterized protein